MQRGSLGVMMAAAAAGLAFAPLPAEAYMGIGGSLGILGAALGMVLAFLASSFMVLTAPIRALKRWLSGTPGQPATEDQAEDAAKADDPARAEETAKQ